MRKEKHKLLETKIRKIYEDTLLKYEKIGLFYGGMGSEAEVSLLSALNIQEHLNQDLYTLVPIFWSPEGKFFQASSVADYHQGKEIAIEDFSEVFDIAFPITH